MKQKIGLALLLCIALLWAEPVTLVTLCDSTCGDTSEHATLADDYIFLGSSLDFSGEAEDLYYIGKSLDFTGETRLGMVALGESIRMNGTTNNGIIGGGGEIVINGKVKGTSFLAAEKLSIRDQAVVDGDLFVGSGVLTVNGVVNGNVYIGAGDITISGVINGNVRVHGGRIKFNPEGRINGDLTYSTRERLPEEENAKVSGTVTYKKQKDMDGFFDGTEDFFKFVGFIINILITISFIIGGSLILFLPICKNLESNPHMENFWQTALWGLIPIFMYPAVFLILLLLGFTIPLAIILALAYVPLFFVAKVVGATMIGEFIAKHLKWSLQKRHYHFLIGAAAFGILTPIPVVGFFTMLLYSSLGWGVFISAFFKRKPTEQTTTDTKEIESK